MSWLATIGVSLITAVAGMLAAGYTAYLAVSWYNISGFEGKSGFFVAFLGLGGLMAGLVLGGVVARLVSGGFLPAAGTSLGVVLGMTLAIGGTARLLADVPPTIGGEQLLLALEYRWPASQNGAPIAGEDEPAVELRSVTLHVERMSEYGAFWFEDSRYEDGRWITPATVGIFTERGKRVLSFVVGDSALVNVQVPLPRRPGRKQLQWSAWLPAELSPSADGATYRFRVQRESEPVRTERYGPFEIEMRASGFGRTLDAHGRRRSSAASRFVIRHLGEPVMIEHPGLYNDHSRLEYAWGVAAINGPKPALLACMGRNDNPCFLLVSEHGQLRSEYVAELPRLHPGHELTSDQSRHELSARRTWMSSRVDPGLFEYGKTYRLKEALLDTKDLQVHRVTEHDDLYMSLWDSPVGVAPDGRSYVRVGTTRTDDSHVLLITDLDGGNGYTLPVDRSRMRFVQREEIGPAWVTHHFEWVRNGDGTDRLAERREFVPLPHRGELGEEYNGSRSYLIPLAKPEIVDALLEFLFDELGADRNTERDEYILEHTVRIDEATVKVWYSDTSQYVSVSTEYGSAHAHLIETIAERLDAVLATGRYDHLFVY